MSKKPTRVVITNAKASRLPRQRGTFGPTPSPDPISAKPRGRAPIRSSASVRVTNPRATGLLDRTNNA